MKKEGKINNMKNAILRLKHVTKRVESGSVLLDDISLDVQRNALVAIIGPSGAGKTTLLQAMSGLGQAVEGEVICLDENKNGVTEIPQIGYVPQANLIHDNLTLIQMLEYAAALRLPKDTSKQEIGKRIDKILRTLELESCSERLIKKLSGGEKKRANHIYKELELVKTLKNLTYQGKTVIYVSHTLLELNFCDQVIVIGKGGKLCFSGSTDEMFEFFESEEYLDIYQKIEQESDKWQEKFKRLYGERDDCSGISIIRKYQGKKERWYQFKILTARYSRLLRNDRKNLFLMFLQAPVLAFALKAVTRQGLYETFWETQEMLFALICVGIWMGLFNSLQEICKERDIIVREYINQVSIGCCLGSKLAVLFVVCLIQSASLGMCYSALVIYPEKSVLFPPLVEMCISLFLTTFSSTCMGLFISSIFRNQEKVMSSAPYILIPQLLFSGVLYELHGFLLKIARLIISYWGVNALSVSMHLTALEAKKETIMDGAYKGLSITPSVPQKAYLHNSVSGLLENWFALAAGCIIMIFLCYWAIRRNVRMQS